MTHVSYIAITDAHYQRGAVRNPVIRLMPSVLDSIKTWRDLDRAISHKTILLVMQGHDIYVEPAEIVDIGVEEGIIQGIDDSGRMTVLFYGSNRRTITLSTGDAQPDLNGCMTLLFEAPKSAFGRFEYCIYSFVQLGVIAPEGA